MSMISIYSDWFKYTIISISYSFDRLLSNSISNRTFCVENISDNLWGNRSSNTAFFIEPYVEKGKERKQGIKTHHNNILDIFKKWGHIHVEPVSQINSLYKTCIPLYFDVVSSFRNFDKYDDEAMIHLGDANYANTYNIIIQIVNLENKNNCEVSQFMSRKEKISIREWTSTSDEYPFYKLAKIFEHYAKEIEQHKELQIISYSEHKGVHYYKLFREEADIIAFGNEKTLKCLKELIDSESQNTINMLQEFKKINMRCRN
jgi:hypothetical protein